MSYIAWQLFITQTHAKIVFWRLLSNAWTKLHPDVERSGATCKNMLQ